MTTNTRKPEASPLVSIIIPCYNAEAYLREAIQSALRQMYSNIEVIVIDDGSTDQSLQIIQSFGEQIKCTSGPNKGGCFARNRGIGIARGEFIQFLDADDILFPSKLTKQVPLALANPDSITYTDHQVRLASGGDVEVRSRPVTEFDPFVFVLKHRTLTISAPLYCRKWLTDIGGFRVGLSHSQEFEMNLRLSAYLSRRKKRFIHLPEVLFEVRRRRESVSSNTATTFSVKVRYLPTIVAELERADELTPHRRTELAAYAASMGRQCIRGGKVTEGLDLIEFAELLDKRSANLRAWGLMSRFVKLLAGPLVAERLSSWKRGRFNSRPA